MIIVLGSVTAKAGDYAEILRLSSEHVQRSRGEPGCLAHAVHQDAENPLRLVFVERWANRASLDTHFRVPAARAFVQALRPLAAEPPQLAFYEATALTG